MKIKVFQVQLLSSEEIKEKGLIEKALNKKRRKANKYFSCQKRI